jgi:hypothetical protein
MDLHSCVLIFSYFFFTKACQLSCFHHQTPRKQGFCSRSVHMGFVVHKMAMGEVFFFRVPKNLQI